MPNPARIALAALLLGAGLVAAEGVRELRGVVYGRAAWLAVDMGAMQLGVAGLTFAVAALLPGRFVDTLGLRAARMPWFAVACVVVGTLGLSHAIDALLELTRPEQSTVAGGVRRAVRIAAPSRPPSPIWVPILGSALAPALFEELLCRGLVQRAVVRAAGPLVAIAVASGLFGVIHMEWTHGLIAGVVGAYLGLASYWADSTRPAILAHTVNNLAALAAAHGMLRIASTPPVSLAVGLALAAAGLAAAGWLRRREPPRAREAALQRAPDPADT